MFIVTAHPRDCAPAERDVSVQQLCGSAGAVINSLEAWLYTFGPSGTQSNVRATHYCPTT